MTITANDTGPFEKKPRAVLLDIDNTLYEYAPAHEKAMLAVETKAVAAGIKPADFKKAFAEARGAVKARLGGTAACHSRLLYIQRALETLGLRTQMLMALDMEQTYWRTLMSTAVLFSGVQDFLQSLRRAGILTCAITDLGAQIQFRKLIYFGLADCFNFVVTSEEAGAEKPAAAPFQFALGKLGITAKETFFIGDDAGTDVIGARAAGIAMAQKRHAGVTVYTDKRKPELAFDNFTELEKLFAGFGWIDTKSK